MKIVIDISKHIYEHAKEQSEDSNDEWDAMRAIANGTPLPKGHKRWLEKCETGAYECVIMKEISQKEAANDVRAKADRWRHQQWL